MSAERPPVVLLILDGWGHRDDAAHNGIALAHKPFFDSLWRDYPHTLIDGSGPAVGLPSGIMGNSEVGHMNIGAGRVVFSGLSQIYQAIQDKSFFSNPALLKAMRHAKAHHSVLHLMGLVSDGAVHSHQDHLYALLKLAKAEGVKRVWIHCFLDGRDTAPRDGLQCLAKLQAQIAEIGVGQIASVSGRYFAMDRDKNWDRTQKAYQAICGTAARAVTDAHDYIAECYRNNIGDEFVPPVCVLDAHGQRCGLQADDAMIFFNFRADRARQMSHAFFDRDFAHFARATPARPAVFVSLTPYEASLNGPTAFMPTYPRETLGEIVSRHGLKQLRLAETEKYAHVTFFFNGGRDDLFAGEERVLIASDKTVPTYDLKPEMRAAAITEVLLDSLENHKHDFVVCNFANTDMVGHTAVEPAIIRAVEVVDACLQKIVTTALAQNGTVIVTADHGNAEMIVDAGGGPMTAHTTNLVPFIVAGQKWRGAQLKASGGRLCDVAPTVLQIFGFAKPVVMTGESLLIENLATTPLSP